MIKSGQMDILCYEFKCPWLMMLMSFSKLWTSWYMTVWQPQAYNLPEPLGYLYVAKVKAVENEGST